MPNLRALAEHDLGFSIEGDYGLRVNLIAPDGIKDTMTADGRPLMGQVLFNIVRVSNEGDNITVDTPTVALRRSSLRRVPNPGENWIVEIPESPLVGAPMVQYVFSATRPPEGGASIGFIRLYLQHVEQP
jgi:hypothetical protein